MFQGSIPPDLQRIVLETVRAWGPPAPIAVACSGNFTIERAVNRDATEIHGNDVTIYTSTIGRYLAGDDPRLDVKHPDFDWLEPWLTEPVDRVATMMLFLAAYGVGPLDPGHAYYDRQHRLYRNQWAELHAGTVEKLGRMTMRLASFYCGDCREYLDQLPPAMPVISFPPFWAGGYENLYKNLDRVFDWDVPAYPVLDEAGIEALLGQIMDRPDWMVGLPERRDDFEPHLRGVTQTLSGQKSIYVYASTAPTRVALGPAHQIKPPKWPILQPDDELVGDLAIVELTQPEFNHVRSMFMDKAIAPASSAAQCWAILDAKRIIGVYATGQPAASFMGLHTPLEPSAYLLSDVTVRSTRHPRLSKLVLYAITSHEAHTRFEQTYGRVTRSVSTSAFTMNPTSMKYRGLFKILKRVELEPEARHRFRIDYWSPLGRWSLSEGWDEWAKRHLNV